MDEKKEKDDDILYVDVDELFEGKGIQVNIGKNNNKTFINKETRKDGK